MSNPPPEETRFKPGHAKVGGRAKGTRNKLSEAFIADLFKHWEENKTEYLRIVGKEEPATIMKLIAQVERKEQDNTPSRLSELTDEQLDAVVELAQRMVSNHAGGESGTDETARGH